MGAGLIELLPINFWFYIYQIQNKTLYAPNTQFLFPNPKQQKTEDLLKCCRSFRSFLGVANRSILIDNG